jgi:hypothetical protein
MHWWRRGINTVEVQPNVTDYVGTNNGTVNIYVCCRKRRLALFVRRVRQNGGTIMPGPNLLLGDDQNVDFTATPVDDAGQPIQNPDGSVAWSSDDTGSLVTLTPSADTFSCNVRAVGGTGSVVLTATHTAADGTSDTGTTGIDIVSTAEVGLVLTPGQPQHN